MKKQNWNFDYSKTLWMKMFLAVPDFPNNRSDVRISFEEALEIIRAVDNLTAGIKKIVYLVGWQGLGHDDCYPEMEIINEALKRDCDETAKDSLLWLIEEAKKANTVISYHGNLADEYSANRSHAEIVAANAVVNGPDGKPFVIEVFNGRDAFKISYKQYYESGLFKKYWDRFCETVPVREAGTVHLDNFCIAQNLNPYTSVEEEDEARNAMLDYIASLGIDVTTEYTYRELELRAESAGHPIRKYYSLFNDELPVGDWRDAPFRTLGRIPASWWTSGMTAEECVKIPASLYSGHLTEPGLLDVFYGAMHGEDIWMKNGNDPKDWKDEFLRQFCTLQLPYFYLNRFDRLSVEKTGEASYTARFSGGVVSIGKEKRIEKDGIVLKDGDNVLLPLSDDDLTFIAYSKDGRSGDWNIPGAAFAEADVFELTTEGSKPHGGAKIKNGKIALSVSKGQALLIRAKD